MRVLDLVDTLLPAKSFPSPLLPLLLSSCMVHTHQQPSCLGHRRKKKLKMNLIQYIAAFNAVALLTVNAGTPDVAQCNGRSALWINPSLCTDEVSKCSDAQILSALNYEMYDVAWGQADEGPGNGRCNGHSALWVNPYLCADTASELSKCSDSQILSASDYEMFEVRDDEQVNSLLTKFMTWASIARDVELQKVHDEEQVNTLLAEFMTWATLTHDIEVQREQAKYLLTEFLTLASITRDVEMQKDQDRCNVDNKGMPWDIEMCEGDHLKLVHRTQPMLGHGDYNFDPPQNPAMSGKEPRNSKSRFGLPREKVRKFMSMLKPRPIVNWQTRF